MRPDATRQALGAWAADKTREQIHAKAREWQVQANRLQADAAALQRRVVWLRRLALRQMLDKDLKRYGIQTAKAEELAERKP